MDLNGYGITTTLQPGWEGRIMKRSEPQVGQADGPMPSAIAPDADQPDADPGQPSTGQAGTGQPGTGQPSTGGTNPAGGPAADRGAWPERTYPVVHLANFGIPDDRGDFGSGAVELMKSDDLFITLFEYGPECVGQALFATQGLPRQLRPDQFSPNALQRTISGQSGLQIFFTEAGRAFCLFIALGSHDKRAELVKKANAALATISIQPR